MSYLNICALNRNCCISDYFETSELRGKTVIEAVRYALKKSGTNGSAAKASRIQSELESKIWKLFLSSGKNNFFSIREDEKIDKYLNKDIFLRFGMNYN